VITACGNAASPELPLTVFPFILRGVSLLGVDSVNCSTMDRIMIWQNLAENWAVDGLEKVFTEISLDGLDSYIDKILNGQVSGRVLIKVS
jgi:NADPH:quinone reductase-like Zn-dependent oxidoreductase